MAQDIIAITINIGSACVAGSLIGLERSYHGRPAGFRTHALVCTASAVLMLLTAYQWQWMNVVHLETIRTDPTRMAQGIMTGIGFLGAGVIFKEGVTVRGLTTAASIWITAALGILYGVGFYYPAVIGTVATLGILSVFRLIESSLPNQFYAQYVMRFARDRMPSEAEMTRLLEQHDFKVSGMSYAMTEGGTVFEFKSVIMTTRKENLQRLAESLAARDDLLEFSISPTGD